MKLYIFDLDGTLTESKTAIDGEMAGLLRGLHGNYENFVAIISGASWDQCQKQLISKISSDLLLPGMIYILPSSGTKGYRYEGYGAGWIPIWDTNLKLEDKVQIYNAVKIAVDEYNNQHNDNLSVDPGEYGYVSEDRGAQVTFSMLGQNAPLNIKQAWDSTRIKRKTLVNIINKYLEGFCIRIGGTTSIDITKHSFDKAFGVNKIMKYLGAHAENTVFVGDGLRDGDNDCAVLSTGVSCIQTSNVQFTKEIIKTFIGDK